MIDRFQKKPLVLCAGAGLGVVQTVVFREYVDVTYGPFPGISGIIPAPWDKWSTFGNILIGGIVFGITTFTKLIASHVFINAALQVYGITAIAGGIANGLFPDTVPARAPAMQLGLGRNRRNGFYTQQYYNAPPGRFYRRPETRAQGFGSDITKNPMAAIPTKIPYNKIIA